MGPSGILRRYNPRGEPWIDALRGLVTRGQYLARGPSECSFGTSTQVTPPELPHLDWVIVGGESGRHARPMHPDWARSLRDQCVAAGVPFFFKQWGAWLPESQDQHGHWNWSDAEEIGALHFWDDNERSASIHLRKSQAGRIMDGRTWDEMPEDTHG